MSRKKSNLAVPTLLPGVLRGMPQSLDAEKGLLCSLLLAPKEVLSHAAARITERHFYQPGHQAVFREIVVLDLANKAVDVVTLTQGLRDQGQLDLVGGPAAISELFTFLPTAANADYYVEILLEKHLLREIIQIGTEAVARAYDEPDGAEQLLDEMEGRFLAIGQARFRGKFSTLRETLITAVDQLETLYRNKGGLSGLATGFSGLDQMTGGLRPAEMVVIAARPSMGKTAFAMNIAEHVAVNLGLPVGVFSLEMSALQLVQRLLCSHARVNMNNVRDGFLSQTDISRVMRSTSALSRSEIYIDDTAGLTILELRAKARRMREHHQIVLLIIDYLQLLRSPSKRGAENRQIEIAEISSGLKALAKELGIPIIVLAQLNRNPEGRTGASKGRPRVSDLRESGSIEQDADVVGLLVRSEVYEDDPEAKQELSGLAELIIAKQRNGPVGEVPLTFLKEFTRFENRAAAGP